MTTHRPAATDEGLHGLTVGQIVPFLRSVTLSGERLSDQDLQDIESALANSVAPLDVERMLERERAYWAAHYPNEARWLRESSAAAHPDTAGEPGEGTFDIEHLVDPRVRAVLDAASERTDEPGDSK